MLSAAPSRRVAAILALLAGLFACTFERETAVLRHDLSALEPAGFGVSPFNIEEKLKRGFIPEVIACLTGPSGRGVETEKGIRLLAEAKLEAGDFPVAEALATRALSRSLRSELRADLEWLRSQAAYWRGDFATAAAAAEGAQKAGRGVPEGWVVFLRSIGSQRLYGGAEPGTRATVRFRYGRPNLLRLDVRVNGQATSEMILDSGASISLVTETAAARLGIAAVEGAATSARGLHGKEIPMRLGWARSVALGALTLRDVPFGILPDGTLTFESATRGLFAPEGVLGVHLMKEFDWRIELPERRLQMIRLEPDIRRGGEGQNLFFRRLKPMVRVSFNRQPWSFFLLDTGSEPTMVTPEGLSANRFTGWEPSAPVTLEGIGKTRVSWAKVSNITLGVDRYAVWFRDLVVNEGADAIGDGIIGMSFLSPFDLEIRFSRMTLSLQRTAERRPSAPPMFEPPSGVESPR